VEDVNKFIAKFGDQLTAEEDLEGVESQSTDRRIRKLETSLNERLKALLRDMEMLVAPLLGGSGGGTSSHSRAGALLCKLTGVSDMTAGAGAGAGTNTASGDVTASQPAATTSSTTSASGTGNKPISGSQQALAAAPSQPQPQSQSHHQGPNKTLLWLLDPLLQVGQRS
jgi:hypothetical protein